MGIAERWRSLPELPGDIRSRLESLIPLFERDQVMLAYLFGSLAEGRTGRDVDLALLRRAGSVHRLWSAIVECLGTERLDLVDLAAASPILRYEILTRGRLLYTADDEVLARFTMHTLHLYRDTARLRARQREYLKESLARWS